jgi:hypothetical protein
MVESKRSRPTVQDGTRRIIRRARRPTSTSFQRIQTAPSKRWVPNSYELLPDGVDEPGEESIIGWAVGAVENSSVTNFTNVRDTWLWSLNGRGLPCRVAAD